VALPDKLFCDIRYDVEKNSDVVYRDLEEPVSCICVGKLQGIESTVVFVGGSCTIQVRTEPLLRAAVLSEYLLRDLMPLQKKCTGALLAVLSCV
jgi:hypothetical protein